MQVQAPQDVSPWYATATDDSMTAVTSVPAGISCRSCSSSGMLTARMSDSRQLAESEPAAAAVHSTNDVKARHAAADGSGCDRSRGSNQADKTPVDSEGEGCEHSPISRPVPVRSPQAAVAPVPLVRSTSSPEPPSSSSSRSSSRIPSSVSSTSSSASANATSSTPSSYTDLAVNGYTIRGPEKKVVYHIDVIGNESQLQTYTIRRSYSEFKALHNGLADVLAARREYYLSQKRLSHVPENAAISTRASQGASRKSQQEDASHPSSIDDADAEAVINFTLPPLPHAGFLSFWRRHDRSHIASRCEMFQELLRAVMKIKVLRESFALQSFLSVAPCAIRQRGSSYVSLCEYSVPQLDPKEECEERKKLARERRRNSSAHSSFVQE